MWYLTPGTLNTCLISSTGEPKERDATTTAVSHRTQLQQLKMPLNPINIYQSSKLSSSTHTKLKGPHITVNLVQLQ